jgi:hypothetical protein
MDIERNDGTKERRTYGSANEMMVDAEKEAQDPETKTLTLHFPKLTVPSGKARKT